MTWNVSVLFSMRNCDTEVFFLMLFFLLLMLLRSMCYQVSNLTDNLALLAIIICIISRRFAHLFKWASCLVFILLLICFTQSSINLSSTNFFTVALNKRKCVNCYLKTKLLSVSLLKNQISQCSSSITFENLIFEEATTKLTGGCKAEKKHVIVHFAPLGKNLYCNTLSPLHKCSECCISAHAVDNPRPLLHKCTGRNASPLPVSAKIALQMARPVIHLYNLGSR